MSVRAAALALGLVVAAGCKGGDDLVWEQFNADGDTIEVEVGVAELGPPVVADIRSSTRQHVIGQAVIDPGSGPFGTRHLLVVEVGDGFDPGLPVGEVDAIVERVRRVSVEVDSGPRGVQEWDLRQDTAANQTWVIELESLGVPGDAPRTDRFTILLWEAVPEAEASDS